MYGRIDIHQHIVLPQYAAWLARRHGWNTGGMAMPPWSTSGAIAMMDTRRIATGILSVSTPGVCMSGVSPAESRIKAREVNELVAEVVSRRPDRFGFFATLTLPDVGGALAEAEYAFDVLRADGVVLLANGSEPYLGDPAFDPLFAELDRRRAVVFIHPSDLSGPEVAGVDTARAVFDLVRAGVMRRYRQLKIILGHAVGFVPYAAYRFLSLLSRGLRTSDVKADFKRFYFDMTLSANPSSLPRLIAFADPSRVMFGSDWPFSPNDTIDGSIESLEAYPFAPALRSAVDRRSAETLFPRLATP